MALRASDKILAVNRSTLQTNMAAASEFFGRWLDLFRWRPPRGGTTAFVELISGESADSFCARVLDGCQVLLLPSSVYDDCPPGEFVRVGLGRRNFVDILRILEEFLSAHSSRQEIASGGQ